MPDGYVFKVYDDFGNRHYDYVVWESDQKKAEDIVKNDSVMKNVTKLKDLSESSLLGIKENLLLGAGIEFEKGSFARLSHR